MTQVSDQPARRGERQGTGFGANIPGMKTAPVEHIVRSKTREAMAKTPEVWKQYNDLSRTIRIVNRAAKGPLAGKAVIFVFGGEIWPDGAAGDFQDSWLQPGEYMDVPKDVALHICGNLWDPALPSKQDIIGRYGDFQYEEHPNGVAGRMAPMVRTGPPSLPDLAVCEVDGRGREKSGWKMMYELYLKNEPTNKDMTVTSDELAAAPEETFEKVAPDKKLVTA